MNMLSAARGRVAKKRLFTKAHHDPIIHQKAVFRTHQPIAAFSDFQRAHHIGVEHIQKLCGIWPLHQKLAQSRGIQQPHRISCLANFTRNRVLMGFIGPRIAIGAAPLPHRLHVSPLFDMPVMHRGLPHRLKNLIARRTRNRAHGNRRVRWAKGGCAHRRNIGV